MHIKPEPLLVDECFDPSVNNVIKIQLYMMDSSLNNVNQHNAARTVRL